MLETAQFAFNAVAPILLMVLLGYLLRRVGLFTDDFLRVANKVVFRVFIPVMLFCNVYRVEGVSAIRWDLVLVALGGQFRFSAVSGLRRQITLGFFEAAAKKRASQKPRQKKRASDLVNMLRLQYNKLVQSSAVQPTG